MLIKNASAFVAKCDVCGRTETFHAASYADAWDIIKRRAWAVRRDASPVIHVCPECPVEVKKIAPAGEG